jgi:seryl-tRNA synthetase
VLLFLFCVALKGVPKFNLQTKPLESSTMIQEEREEIFHQLDKLENQFNELSVKSITCNELMEKKMEHMENNMDENRVQIEKKMEELQNSMSTILQTLDGRLSKSDIVTKETHENKGSVHVEQPYNNKHFSGGFNSNIGANYGWVPKGANLPKVELKNFDGT